MIPPAWREGEVAVIGLGRSGTAATEWLIRHGVTVYASDAAAGDTLHVVAARLRAIGACVDLGGHDLDRIRRASAVVVSPGVPPDAPPLAAARAAAREIVAELDLAVRALPDVRTIVVTGTNGKSTTTAMIGHVLATAGVRVEVGGNIGRALIGIADLQPRPDWAVIEASSFQLHDAPHLDPTIGVLTNLSPDHLNRYASVTEYYADKRRMLQHADGQSIWVVNGDDAEVQAMMRGVPGRVLTWSREHRASAWLDGSRAVLVLHDADLLARDAFPLLGDHNVENALAAALAAQAAGVANEHIANGLRSFQSLPHRLEPVRELDGVVWINDSKATNVASARAALRGMDRPYVLIAGGRHKDEDFRTLAPLLTGCRVVVAYGEAAGKFEREIGAAVPLVTTGTLGDAVREARRRSHRGDAVLLSPACTSYDQFNNYEERGDAFKDLVRSLT